MPSTLDSYTGNSCIKTKKAFIFFFLFSYVYRQAGIGTYRRAHAWTHMIQISSVALIKSNNISWISAIINADKDHKTILKEPWFF